MISRPRNRLRAHSESVTRESERPIPSSSKLQTQHAPQKFDESITKKYPHSSAFKSPEMTITVNSQSIRSLRRTGEDTIFLPIFADNDRVTGTVTLDPQNCAAESGRLTISIEGVFEYVSPMNASKPGPSQIHPGRHRHVFYQDCTVIPIYTTSEPPTRRPFRSAFTATLRKATSTDIMRPVGLKHARSMEMKSGKGSSVGSSNIPSSNINSPSASPKTFNFDFELPKSDKFGDEFPSSFSSSNVVSAGVRGRVYSENAEVKYRIKVSWEALDGSGSQAQLEAQFLFQPDCDFQSLDAHHIAPDSWTESPLSKVDEVPVECAITLPTPAEFSRLSSIPYFVVFTTTPRSRSLAAEIMADATIAVSLVRRVGFDRPTPARARAATLPNGSAPTMLKSEPPAVPSIPTTITTLTSSSKVEDIPPTTTSPTVSDPTMPSVSEAEEPVAGPSRERSGSGGQRLLKRVVRSAPPILAGLRITRGEPEHSDNASVMAARKGSSGSISSIDKPLPNLPQLLSGLGSPRFGSKSKPPSPTVSTSSVSSSSSISSPTSATSLSSDSSGTSVEGPEIPPQRVTDTRTLHTDVSVGFPKRPKGRMQNGTHPSLETVSNLPDGLYKGNIPLQKGWFPSIQWKGLKIEYFLQVSVIFDKAEFKAQVPLCVY